MPKIQIICARPGPTTTERILGLVNAYPHGITIKELCTQLNRPVSMVQHCLKPLLASGQIQARLSASRMHFVYFPSSNSQ